MINNPILLKDPLGDTTWLYNQNGVFLGVIGNKKSKNQVHYIQTDGNPGQVVDFDKLSKKDQRAYEKRYRELSIAFIGSKLVESLKNILHDPKNKGLESLFVGKIGPNKEIMFPQVDVPNSQRGIDFMYPIDQLHSHKYLLGK